MAKTKTDPLESWLSAQGERVVALTREIKYIPDEDRDRLNDAAGIKGQRRKAPPSCPGQINRILQDLPPCSARDAMALEAANTVLETMREAVLSEMLFLVQSARLELEDMSPELPEARSLLDGVVADLNRQRGRSWDPCQAAVAVSAPMIQVVADCAAIVDAGEDPDGHAATAKKMAGEAYQWLARLL